jgi:hypothetical protein
LYLFLGEDELEESSELEEDGGLDDVFPNDGLGLVLMGEVEAWPEGDPK